jgi:transposase
MKNCIANFLEIQGYKTDSVREEKSQELVVRIRKKKSRKNKCPGCGSTKISCHAKGKFRLKKHSNFQEKLIYLEVKRDRLICLKCRKVFAEELPTIKKYSRTSENFIKQSLNYLSKNSFNEVGKVNSVGYQSLKNNLYDNVDPFKLMIEKIKVLEKMDEIFLGLDGQSFRGQDMVLTIAEVVQRELLTILPSELQGDLERFLRQLPLNIRLKVKGIAMDMTNKHFKLLKKYFPNALIVIDHYHVISCALMHLQKIRTVLQVARRISIPIKQELNKNYEELNEEEKTKMRRYFKLFPELEEAYWAKEEIRSIYRISKHRKAEHRFKTLKQKLLKSKEIELRELGRTMINWEEEILNYFKCRITNAYTEGIHTKCKLIKRKSFGFRNVGTYIRKLILGILPFVTIWGYTHFST